jgi:benzylsuccinate CoA-transferase BbsF subunit
VLELTTAVAGPVAGAVLGDMGADVIKVENPRGRTVVHTAVPPPKEGAPDHPYNRSPFFNELHRSKRLLALDLASDEGRALVLRLVAKVDVVIENFSPPVIGRLGLDYEALRRVREDIILVSMPGFGKTGPYSTRGSYGPGIDAMSGLSHLTGYPDRGPGKPAQFYCDQNAGLTAALVTMAALRHRRLHGEGQYIELAMLEGEMQLIAPALMDVTMNGRSPSRSGNRHAWHAPQGVYRCAGDDRWVAIAVQSDEDWRALVEAIGRDDLASDARYASAAGRQAEHDTLDAAIEAWTSERTPHAVQTALQAIGIAAGALLDIAEVHADPQLAHRGSLVTVEHPEMGPFPHTRTAWRSRRGHDGVASAAPTYANGNAFALQTLLGLDGRAVEDLEDRGVIANEPRG